MLFSGTRPKEHQYEVALCRLEKRPKHLILNPPKVLKRNFKGIRRDLKLFILELLTQ